MHEKPRHPFAGACHVSGAPATNQQKDVKEKVREYLERRQTERRQNARSPIHDLDQIRQEIGWEPVERRQHHRRSR